MSREREAEGERRFAGSTYMSPKDETRLSGAEISLREERPVMRHALRQRQRGLPATSRRGHATLLPGYGGRRFPASLTASAVLLPSSGGRRLPCRAGETETREGEEKSVGFQGAFIGSRVYNSRPFQDPTAERSRA